MDELTVRRAEPVIHEDDMQPLVDLIAERNRYREACDGALKIAFRHEVQYWQNDPRPDAEKLDAIVGIMRTALAQAQGG